MATQFDILAYRIDKLKKQLGYKQIKYSDGPLSGPVTCCNILGVDKTTGTIYYKDEEGNWAEVPGGGGEPAKYKVYTALLTQYETNAPTATVLENTLGGEVVWTRDAAGEYRATLIGAFPYLKTFCITGGYGINPVFLSRALSDDFVRLVIQDQNAYGVDDIPIQETLPLSIEIRVYN